MKFVKGDVIAGLVIVLVNLVGGLLIGIAPARDDRGRGAADATRCITIGDGLVSQIPSLCIAVAAGLVVTRVRRGDGTRSLGGGHRRAVLREPEALWIVAGICRGAGAHARDAAPALTFLAAGAARLRPRAAGGAPAAGAREPAGSDADAPSRAARPRSAERAHRLDLARRARAADDAGRPGVRALVHDRPCAPRSIPSSACGSPGLTSAPTGGAAAGRLPVPSMRCPRPRGRLPTSGALCAGGAELLSSRSRTAGDRPGHRTRAAPGAEPPGRSRRRAAERASPAPHSWSSTLRARPDGTRRELARRPGGAGARWRGSRHASPALVKAALAKVPLPAAHRRAAAAAPGGGQRPQPPRDARDAGVADHRGSTATPLAESAPAALAR